jgi:hypothetical protein
MRTVAVIGCLIALVGCDQRAQSASHSAEVNANTASAAQPSAAVRGTCSLSSAGLRIAADSVAGLPTDRPIAELDRRCPSDSVDDYGIGGTTAKARIYRFTGGAVAAVQSDNDSALQPTQPADLWSAEGDSLRLPDGRPMPATIGALRAAYPRGFVSADKRDDSDGVLAYVCAFPRLTFVLGYDTPTPADTGHWAFKARPVPDSIHLWRIEVWPEKWWRTTAELCAQKSAT